MIPPAANRLSLLPLGVTVGLATVGSVLARGVDCWYSTKREGRHSFNLNLHRGSGGQCCCEGFVGLVVWWDTIVLVSCGRGARVVLVVMVWWPIDWLLFGDR